MAKTLWPAMLTVGGTSGDFIIFHLMLLRLSHRLLDKLGIAALPCTSALPHFPNLSQTGDSEWSPAAAGWQYLPRSLSWSQWSRSLAGLSPCQHSPLDSKSSKKPASKHSCSYVATTLRRNIYRNIAKHSFPFQLWVAVCIFLDTLCISPSTPQQV